MDNITFTQYEQERRSKPYLPPITVPNIRYQANLEKRIEQLQQELDIKTLKLEYILEEIAFVKSDVEDFINSDRKDAILTATIDMLETILKENK